MPRLHEISRAETNDPIVTYAFDRRFPDRDPATETGRGPGNSFGSFETVLANSPECIEHVLLGLELWQRPDVLDINAELAACIKARVGELMNSRLVLASALGELHAAGAVAERRDALAIWPTSSEFTAAERAAFGYVDAIVQSRGRLTDDLFAALRSFYDDRQIITIGYLAGTQMMLARMARALRLEEDDRPAGSVTPGVSTGRIEVPLRAE